MCFLRGNGTFTPLGLNTMTLAEAVEATKTRYTRQDIIDLAVLKLYGPDKDVNTSLYPANSELGVCGVVLRQLLVPPGAYNPVQVARAVARVLEHYEIPVGYVPAVPVFHEALGLVVQLKRVLSLLFTDPEMVPACHRFMVGPSWDGVLMKLASLVDSPHDGVKLPESPGDVNLMSPAEVEAILRRVVSLPQRGPTQQETVT